MPQLQDQREKTLKEGRPLASVLKQARHAGAKEGPAPTPAGIPGRLCLQPPSETPSHFLLVLPLRAADVHQAPLSGILHAHKSGVSKHDHRCMATGTKLCHWHLGTR